MFLFFWGEGPRLQKGIGATVVWIMPGSSFIAGDTCLDLLHDILAAGARQDFHLRRSVDPTGRPWAFHGTRSAQECQQSHTWSHAATNEDVICLSRVFQPNAAESKTHNIHVHTVNVSVFLSHAGQTEHERLDSFWDILWLWIPSWTRTRYCRFQSNHKAACVKHRSQMHTTTVPYCIRIVCKWHYCAVVEKHFEAFCNCIGTSLRTKTCWTMLNSCCALFPHHCGTTPFLWSHWEYHSARHGGRAAYKTPFERFRRQIIAQCHHLLGCFFFRCSIDWRFGIQSHIVHVFYLPAKCGLSHKELQETAHQIQDVFRVGCSCRTTM